MDAELNPYAPPNSLRSDIASFAPRYRVDASKTTLGEFRNMTGKPLAGTLLWIALQAGLMRFDKQIVDGPRAFADDQCNLDDLRDPVRSRLLATADSAEKLGFHSRSYTVSHSTGVAVHGGAIRMLHESGELFLQILASASGAHMQGYENIISATRGPVTVFASTNGRPNFNPPPCVTTQRRIGVSLQELLDLHRQSIAGVENLISFPSFADVGAVIDHLSHVYFADKIARGIFVPELSIKR